MQQKLLNHLYFLDETDPRHLVSRRYEHQFLGLYLQVSTLYSEGELKAAEPLCRKALRIAQTQEMTQYAVLCGQLLRSIYADMRLPVRYQANKELLARNQQLLALEEEAAQIYWDIKATIAYTVRTRRSILEKMEVHVKQLEQLHRQAGSYATFLYHYRTRLIQEELIGNYEAVIRITADTAQQLAQGKINDKRFDKRFNAYISVYAHFRSRQAVKGLKLAEEYAKDFHYSSVNWLYYLEIYLLLAIHAGQYGQALELMDTARKNVHFAKQRALAQQRWDLYEAYLQFVRPEISPVRMRNFTTFVQTIPDHSRDKQGYNVAVLILQFLHFLRQRDVESILTRLEGLRKYQQRHLRESGNLRSQLFFRMLAVTVKSDFDPVRSQQKAEPLLKKLQAAPPPGEAFAEIEIVPYEELWQITLEILRATALYNALQDQELR
ncbi:hypothetical protein KBK19_06080 [Microvirga sp. STR05]|uniref:Tetratricopeptide repeat protein n=1 Tax=Hymenobacter duratus TaxID=2771356 RepID=A0ABR8JFT7_9BACT|nr:hypothetical protein [Hymenobacter duratus]MBD2714596.1 hypothetical protein [Hymenobacter duratus]MBR7949500.1 hypothetical protein [Microvirga sp. STR05]